MPAPIFSLPVTGSDPKVTTKQILENNVNAVLASLYGEIATVTTGLNPRGGWDASTGAFPSGAEKGDYYIVSGAGMVGSATFVVGDWLVALVDTPSTATFEANWFRADYSQVTPKTFASIAALAAYNAAIDGQVYTIELTGERFKYDADSTSAANGTTVVTATGMGVGRWVTTRTEYVDYEEFTGDVRDSIEVGATVKWRTHHYRRVAAEDKFPVVANAAGLLFEYQPVEVGATGGIYDIRALGAKCDYIGGAGTDDTAAYNLATGADKPFAEYLQRRAIYVPGSSALLGTVYQRKGQSIYGHAGATTRLFMAGTGSIIIGERSNGDKDSGGAPPCVKDLFIEGGNVPISCEVSGYQILNVFFSFSGSRPLFAGSDGKIIGCTFDGGGGLLRFGGGGNLIDDCTFFLGSTQLTIVGVCNSSIISNSNFVFAGTKSINFIAADVRALKIVNCKFGLNEQFATHECFIGTQFLSDPISLKLDMDIEGCEFRNGRGPAVKITNGSDHDIRLTNNIFNGVPQSASFTQGTLSSAVEVSAPNTRMSIKGGEIKNMNFAPIRTTGSNVVHLTVGGGIEFRNNGGSVDIDFANTNGASTLTLGEIYGSGRMLFAANSNTAINVENAKLKDWYDKSSSGGRDFIKLPFIGAGKWDMTFISNPTDGSGNAKYRTVESYSVGVYYGFSGSDIITKCNLIETSIFADAGVTQSTIIAEIGSLGDGTTINPSVDKGFLYISWPDTYFADRITINPVLYAKVA